MHVVSKYQWSSAIGSDTSMLWLISILLINIGELWKSTTECGMYNAMWHGYLLSHLSKKCSFQSQIDEKSPYK